jgi:alpha-L-fucosidase
MVVDNKYYFQYFPGDFRLWDPKIAHKADKKQYLQNGKSYYMPFEHTICLSYRWNWFQKKDIIPVRALDELEELFYWCTDNNNSLVLNVPPDNTGQLREHEVNAIIGLGKRLNIKKGKPLPKNGKFISINALIVASSTLNNDEAKFGAKWAVDGGMQTSWAASDTIAELVLNLDQNQPFNKISIFENQIIKVAKDQFTTYRTNRIQSYCIDNWTGNTWKTIYMSEEPMGDCKVIRFPTAYKASKLRFKVLKATAPPSITELNVIYMNN